MISLALIDKPSIQSRDVIRLAITQGRDENLFRILKCDRILFILSAARNQNLQRFSHELQQPAWGKVMKC